MVKLTSFLALSTLIIVPALASELSDLETRDITTEPDLLGREPTIRDEAVSARDMEGLLFARQQDFDHPELASVSGGPFDFNWRYLADTGKAAWKIGFSSIFGCGAHGNDNLVPVQQYTAQDLLVHPPPTKHEFVDRNLDGEQQLYARDFTDEDLFERFDDDLD